MKVSTWALVFAAQAIAAASTPWNGSNPAYVAFVCDPVDACCAPYIAMAKLAAEHVNAKDDAIVPELASLPDGMPSIEVVEILTARHNAYGSVSRYYRDTPTERLPVALAGLPETEMCEVLSPLLEVLDIPSFTVSATGALGRRGSAPKEYGSIYQMLAPNDEMTPLLYDMISRFNFTGAALLYDDAVHEEERITHDLTEHGTVFEPYAITSLGKAELDGVFDRIERAGVQTFVCIFQNAATMNAVVSYAYSRGIVGSKRSAVGFVWIAAGGYMPWMFPGAHRDHYLGMLSVQQHAYDDDKLDLMEESWGGTMSHQCKLAPEGIPFTIPDRSQLPYEECLGLGSSYDAIVATAFGLASRLDGQGRRLAAGSATSPAGGPDSTCASSRASGLNSALHEGVAFGGLSGPVVRSGEPWADKQGRWEVSNLQTAAEGGHPVILYEWTQQSGFIASHRRLGGSAGSSSDQLSDSAACKYLWPGNTCTKPEGVIHSPCEHVDCGSHGQCQNRPSLGRDMGWCQCDVGYIGAHCETLYHPYLLSDYPGIQLHSSTHVDVNIFVQAFNGINDGDPSGYTVRCGISLHWVDERVVHLRRGSYSIAEADSLRQEGILWMPEYVVAKARKLKKAGGELVIGSSGRMELLLLVDGIVDQQFDWKRFPFDSHELEFMVFPKHPTTTTFKLKDCSTEFLIKKAQEACSGMAEEGAFAGVPRKTLDNHWTLAWTPIGTSMQVLSKSGRLGLQLLMHVRRATDAFSLRLFISSCCLVVASWGGFFISPRKLMPRLVSSLMSFVALQKFNIKVQAEMPGNASNLTWIDVYLSAVGLLMIFAVLENIYAQFANEHFCERSALRIDRACRLAFPISFSLLLIFLFVFRDQVFMASIVSHGYLLMLAVALISFSIHDSCTYRHRIMKHEARRIHDLKAAWDKGSPLPIRLEWTDREVQSMFNLVDKNRRGFVDFEQVLPWVVKYFPCDADCLGMVDSLAREAIGVHHVHGVQVGSFKDMLTKIVDIIVNKIDVGDQTLLHDEQEQLVEGEEEQEIHSGSKKLNVMPEEHETPVVPLSADAPVQPFCNTEPLCSLKL